MKKKLLTLLLAGCMVLSMTACGKKAEEQTEKQEVESTTEETEQIDTSVLGTSKLVELGEYKGLTYTPMDTTVTDEEVEEEVQYRVTYSSTMETQDVVTETSYVNIDYVGTKEGVAFDGGTASNQELSIENSGYIEGFAESIIGMKAGETKECPMTFPEDYGVEELNGADVVFTITVNSIWENVPAELNDVFAQTQGYDDVAALYAGVREIIEKSKQQEAESDMEYQLATQIIASSTFEMNEDEVELYIGDLTSQYESYASYYGYDLESYVTIASGMSMSEFEEQCREISLYRIQYPLIQQAIAEAEGISFTEEEYTEMAQEYVEYYGYESLEALEEAYTRETVEMQITADKAMAYVVENAVAVEAAEE